MKIACARFTDFTKLSFFYVVFPYLFTLQLTAVYLGLKLKSRNNFGFHFFYWYFAVNFLIGQDLFLSN